jgi:hypothetical protein
MGHKTHSVARAKPYIRGSWCRTATRSYMVVLLNAMVSLSVSVTVAQAI